MRSGRGEKDGRRGECAGEAGRAAAAPTPRTAAVVRATEMGNAPATRDTHQPMTRPRTAVGNQRCRPVTMMSSPTGLTSPKATAAAAAPAARRGGTAPGRRSGRGRGGRRSRPGAGSGSGCRCGAGDRPGGQRGENQAVADVPNAGGRAEQGDGEYAAGGEVPASTTMSMIGSAESPRARPGVSARCVGPGRDGDRPQRRKGEGGDGEGGRVEGEGGGRAGPGDRPRPSVARRGGLPGGRR